MGKRGSYGFMVRANIKAYRGLDSLRQYQGSLYLGIVIASHTIMIYSYMQVVSLCFTINSKVDV